MLVKMSDQATHLDLGLVRALPEDALLHPMGRHARAGSTAPGHRAARHE